jgi:hypothetical protein
LPFLFIFNTDLLLMNVDWWHGIIIFLVATAAMLIFAASTQGWFLTRSRWYESILLLLVAFTLFRPGFWLDMVSEPYREIAPQELVEQLGRLEQTTSMRLRVLGEDLVGNEKSFMVALEIPADGSGEERLKAVGLELMYEDERLLIDRVGFASTAAKLGLEFDQEIVSAKIPVERIRKEIMWLPGLAIFVLVCMMQLKRRKKLITANPS